ncbi:MAG: MFS transporter [Dehalococcoidia bacterium]|nr:MFS transporter [Dehalococcoidia bacterium]
MHFLGPLGGVAADQFDRRRLLLVSQWLLIAIALGFATLVLLGHVEVWHLLAFSLLSGIGWAINTPVRQTLVSQIVPRDELMNALALNAAGFNATRIAGPALAGLMIAAFGPAQNFYLQAAMYVVVAVLFAQLRLGTRTGVTSVNLGTGFMDGVRYVKQHPTLRTQLTLVLLPVLLALPYTSLLPVLARDTLDRGAGHLGLMIAAPGVGAVIATMVIASLSGMRRKGLVLLAAVFCLGVALALIALTRSFPLTIALLVIVGGAQMTYTTTNQTVLQLTTPPEYRGRVMGIYMLNQGLFPLGSVLVGLLTDLTEVHVAFAVMGCAVALIAAVFTWRAPSLRNLVVS